jgi:hypothetical protein
MKTNAYINGHGLVKKNKKSKNYDKILNPEAIFLEIKIKIYFHQAGPKTPRKLINSKH